MSNRIEKRSSKSQQRNTQTLLSAILSHSVEMPPCSFCKSKGFSCSVSVRDSSRCFDCVRLHQSHCDVHGFSASALRRIADQHQKLEAELEAAEEEQEAAAARVRRLRKVKRQWAEKMTRAVARGLDSVEELERLEREESGTATEGQAAGPSAEIDWSSFDVADPGFLRMLGGDVPIVASGEGSSGPSQ